MPVLVSLLILAAALRVPGLFTDFWLDEIWTLKLVYRLDSALGVFTEVRHSNNHHLNTLVYYALVQLLGDVESWLVYRVHSLVAGVASIALAWRIGARAGRVEAVFAAGLCATSYLLIHFSSEGRGYALVVFFALASFDALQGWLEHPGRGRAAVFGVSAILGFLSHLMYLHVFVGAAGWMALALWRVERHVARAARRWLSAFALPTVFLLWFWWFDVRLTKIGDGPETDPAEVLVRALSYAVGGPAEGALAAVAAGVAVLVWAGAVVWLVRERRDEWVFFAVVIFVSPGVAYAVMRPDVFFVRYFLLGTTFALVAFALPLAAAWRSGGTLRAGAGVLVALFALGNAVDTARFYEHGRGGYLAAIRFIVASTPDRLATVAGDHRFRNLNVIRFYNRFLPEDERLIYVEQREHPEWMLLHRIGKLGEVDPGLRGPDGHGYELAKVVRYSDLSGWHWLLYRRQHPED